MDQDLENLMVGRTSHRNSRRSSILKDSSGRKPLESIESNLQRRRSLKRVSFADTNTIKFDDDAGVMGPLQHFTTNQLQPPPAESFETIPPKDDTTAPEDFLVKFLNLAPSASLTDNTYRGKQTQNMDDDMEMTCPAGEVARLTHGDITEKITTDMELTCPASQVARLTHGDVTEKITTDMELTCPAGEVARLTQSDVTEKITMDMEMTFPANQVSSLTPGGMTEITTDMELTCPVSQVAGLTHGDMTEKIATDMELTCPASQVARLTHDDMTEKITTDMELTCPASQVARLTCSDMTGKITTDVELTCPASQVARLTHDDMTEKITTDMELTCPASQVARLTHGDMTGKITTDMELTCPASQVARLTRSDMTGKITTDVELTCPASQVARLTHDDMTEKITTDMELTCPASQVARLTHGDMTGKITTDMELTCPASQVARLTHGDMTEKITTDMELTCPASQVARLTHGNMTEKITMDMEITYPAGEVSRVTQGDMTKKSTMDMEMTYPAGEVARLSEDDTLQKITTGVMSWPAGHIANLIHDDASYITSDSKMTAAGGPVSYMTQDDLTLKITADVERASPVVQVANSTTDDLIQKITADKEVTCEAGQITKLIHDDSLQRKNENMEFRCPAGQVTKFTRDDLTQKINSNTKIAHPTCQTARLTQDELAQEITSDKEVTQAAGQRVSLMQEHPLEKKMTEMELTCPALQTTRLIHDDLTQTTTITPWIKITDVEGTFPTDQVARFTQDDQTQITQKEAITQLKQGAAALLPEHSKVSSPFSHTDSVINFSLPIFQSFSLEPKDYEKENETEYRIKEKDGDDAHNNSFNHNQDQECFEKVGDDAKKATPIPFVHEINQSQLCGKRLHTSASTDEPSHKCFVNDVSCSPSCLYPLSPAQAGSQSFSLSQAGSHTTSPSQTRSYPLSQSKASPNFSFSSQGSSIALTPSQTGSHGHHSLLERFTDERVRIVSNIPENTNHNAEELLDDISLSLINMDDNSTEICPSTGDANSQLSSQELVPKERKVKKQNQRESVAADAVDQAMPLITSFIERISMLHKSYSDLEMQLKEMSSTESDVCPTEQSVASLSFQHINKNTSITLNQPDDFIAKVPELSSPSLHINSIANVLQLDSEDLLAPSAPQLNICTHLIGSHASMQLKMEGKLSKISGGETLLSDTQGYMSVKPNESHLSDPGADCASRSTVQPAVCIQVDHCEKVDDKSDTGKMLSVHKVPDGNEEQQPCSRGCSLSIGSTIYTPSGHLWIVKDVHEGGRYLRLKNSPLELCLNLVRYNSHWRVFSTAWSPQASEVSDACGKLVLNVLGCRMESAVAKLGGLFLCNIGDILAKVSAAYQDIFNLIVELQILKASYLTLFMLDSIKVTLFSLDAHVSVEVLVHLQPPLTTPDELYILHPSASITIGNLRHQTVEEAIAGVSPGPRHLTRLVQAVDFIVQSLAP